MADPQWKGLFEWSMKHNDGTRISDMNQTEVDPAKMAWLQEVLASYVKDLVTRLQEIKKALEESENEENGIAEQEALLEELQEIVEDIDQAKNLHLIGGLSMLKELLESAHSSLRSRAAEVIATCVQNNYEVQQAFFDDGVLPMLLSVAGNDDITCRLKGWMAISCLIRNFPAAVHAFEERNGFEHLLQTLDVQDSRMQRRGLFLIAYLLSMNEERHLSVLRDSGSVEQISGFMSSDDVDVRERAVEVLSSIAVKPTGRKMLLSNAAFLEAFRRAEEEVEQLTKDEKEMRQSEMHLMLELKNRLSHELPTESNQESASAPLLLLKP